MKDDGASLAYWWQESWRGKLDFLDDKEDDGSHRDLIDDKGDNGSQRDLLDDKGDDRGQLDVEVEAVLPVRLELDVLVHLSGVRIE